MSGVALSFGGMSYVGGSNKLVSMRDAAERLGYSYVWFSRQYRGWGLKSVRIGRKVMFTERDLDAFVDRRRGV